MSETVTCAVEDLLPSVELVRALVGSDRAQAARSLGDQVGLALQASGGSAQHRMNVAATWIEKPADPPESEEPDHAPPF